MLDAPEAQMITRSQFYFHLKPMAGFGTHQLMLVGWSG
jgi:hypothetical protein